MNPVTSKRWQNMQQMGRSKYVVLNGILLYGVLVTAILSIVELIGTKDLSFPFTVIRLVIFATIGFFIGTVRWQIMERKYGGK